MANTEDIMSDIGDNPLKQLSNLEQSIWLDYIRRDLISGGDLRHLIENDGLRGMTSNPAIFEKAISGSNDYDADIRALAAGGKNCKEIYDAISLRDVRDAATVFRPVYASTSVLDGYVSLEVNPHLAHDTQGTIEEARRLWQELDQPNVFIKVPATLEGLPAIRQLISEGININVTLIFGLPRYRQVAEAYIAGMEDRCSQDKPLRHVASVASFFLSRIDTLIDPILEKIIQQDAANAVLAVKLRGEVAVASAKAAYQIYRELFFCERFQKLMDKGALVQRLLWASTGTKNPQYSDVKYVDSIIAPNTVNTVPVETLNAYRDHGQPAIRIEDDIAAAMDVFKSLPELGISIDQVTQQLEDEGVEKFNKPYDDLMQILEKKSQEAAKAE
jgi:transaldolase/glucose-6-phosphate isomerase